MTTYADEDREPLEMEWIWQGRLPRGAVVLVAGWRQSAKGLLCCNVASAITTGKPLPGEAEARDPGDVIMIMAEDDPNEDMAWRLRAAGADLARVHDMTELDDGSPFELSASRTDPGHTPELLACIRQLRDEGRNPRLVVMDPLNALVMNGSIRTDQGARRVVGRLQQVAKRTGVTILVVHHRVKSGSIGGSQGLEDAPRWVYTIEPDPAAPEYKVFHLHKHNAGAAEDLRYKIIEDGHDSRIEWVDRAQIESEERSWRKPRLAFLHGRKVPDPASYAALCTVKGTTFTLGSGLTQQQAQHTCQEHAGTHLTWTPEGTSKPNGPAAYSVQAS